MARSKSPAGKAAVVAAQIGAITHLSPKQRRMAEQAIAAMHDEYHGRGGIQDVYHRLNEKLEGTSSKIYNLARAAVRQTESLEQAARLFSYLCAHAEQIYKEAHKISNLRDKDRGLPPWPVFKSNILRGMKLGLSPLDYPSEHAFRDATMERVRAEIGLQHRPKLLPRPNEEVYEALDELLTQTLIDDGLREAAAEALSTLQRVEPSTADQAAAIMRRAVERISALIQKHQESRQ
jgi:hypothetical protein